MRNGNRPIHDKFTAIRNGLENCKGSDLRFTCKCPAHDDTNNSLSVALDDDKILVKCFSGCETEQIMSSMGMSMSDLFSGESTTIMHNAASVPTVKSTAKKRLIPEKVLKSYGLADFSGGIVIPYLDTKGKHIQQGDMELSRFRVMLDGKEKVKSKRGSKLRLYGMNSMAKSRHDHFWIVEGESDCWSLWYADNTAVGVPGSTATNTLQDVDETIEKFSSVFVSQEPGKAGVRFADRTIEYLANVHFRGTVYVVRWDEYGVKDPADLLVLEGSIEDYKARIEGIKNGCRNNILSFSLSAKARMAKKTVPAGAHVQHAKNIASVLAGDIYYDIGTDSWIVWNHTHMEWRRSDHAVFKLISEYFEYMDISVSYSRVSQTEKSLRSIIDCDVDSLDLEDNKVLSSSGVINLNTGEIDEPDRKSLMVSKCPVEYNPNARSPLWEYHIDKIFGGDPTLMDSFQRAIGYSMIASTDERLIFICYGPGRNGKSKTIEIIKRIMGQYACTFPISFLLSDKQGPDPTYNEIRTARLACSSEVNEKAKFNEAIVKSLTGGDTIVGRNLFSTKNIKFKPRAKFWLIVNSLPSVADTSPAFWDRIRIFPFTVRIKPEDIIKDIEQKLWEEKEGIFNWMVKGAIKYLKHGMIEAEQSKELRMDYMIEEDDLGQFVNTYLEIPQGDDCDFGSWWQFSDIYNDYILYCESNNIKFSKSRKSVSSYLRNYGFKKKRTGTGIEYFIIMNCEDKRMSMCPQ